MDEETPPPHQGQFRLPDPALVTRTMAEVAERGQRIVSDFLKRQSEGGAPGANPDPLNIGSAFLEMTTRLMTNPTRLVQAQIGFRTLQIVITVLMNSPAGPQSQQACADDIQRQLAQPPLPAFITQPRRALQRQTASWG